MVSVQTNFLCVSNDLTNQTTSLRSLSNAQYFVHELLQHHAFSLAEVSENSMISQQTLKDLYALKICSLSINRFRSLVQFYCAVVYTGVKPQWFKKINKVV